MNAELIKEIQEMKKQIQIGIETAKSSLLEMGIILNEEKIVNMLETQQGVARIALQHIERDTRVNEKGYAHKRNLLIEITAIDWILNQ